MQITVIVCTHNRLELLRQTVEHIDRAVRPESVGIQLTIVANACNDGTEGWLEERVGSASSEAIPTTWWNEPTPGKSHALNLALAHLATEWAVFIDDDQRVSDTFFECVARAFGAYPNVRIFCSRILPDWTGNEPAWVHDEGPYRIYPPPIHVYDLGNQPLVIGEDREIPGGGVLIVHRSVFDNVGGFNADLGPRGHDLGGSEDTDFVRRALGTGEVIQYVPDILQYHYVDMDRLRLGYLMRKAYHRSRSITRVKHPGCRPIPRYFWRKLLGYGLRAIWSIDRRRMRFFLVRMAATLGEIRGLRDEAVVGPSEHAVSQV